MPPKKVYLLPFFTSNKLVSAEYRAHQTIALPAIKIPANVDMCQSKGKYHIHAKMVKESDGLKMHYPCKPSTKHYP